MSEMAASAPVEGERPSDAPVSRLRHILPPVAAAILVGLAHLAYGAVQPVAAITLSGVIALIAAYALIAAGLREATPGMGVGILAVIAIAAGGVLGPLERAAPDLARLVGAGGLWIIGYLAGRRPAVLNAAWRTTAWSGSVYCLIMFMAHIGGAPQKQNTIADAFATPAEASVLFGLLAVIATGRILHVLKQAAGSAELYTQILDRVVRHGLDGVLLLLGALTCLILTGSGSGLLVTCGMLVAQVGWAIIATGARNNRDMRSQLRLLIVPIAAMALIGWGVSDMLRPVGAPAPGLAAPESQANDPENQAGLSAVNPSPQSDTGLGMIADNAEASIDGQSGSGQQGAATLFGSLMGRAGLIGAGLLALVLAATHFTIFTGLKVRRTPRTFLRMSLVAGLLMAVHGITDSSLDLPSAVWLYAFVLGSACGLAAGDRSTRQIEG